MKKSIDTTLREIISQNIRSSRLKSGLTQRELAELCGFKIAYLSRLENEPQNLSVDILEKIGIALNVPISELVTHERIGIAKNQKQSAAENLRAACRQIEMVINKIEGY